MFDVILKSTKVLNQVDILDKQIKACSGDELLHLRDIFRDILQGKDQKNLSDDLVLIAHLYTVFNKIGGKKFAEITKVTDSMSSSVGKDLEEVTDEGIIKCLNANEAPYWKYNAKSGLHSKEYKHETSSITYYANKLYSPGVVKFYKERR